MTWTLIHNRYNLNGIDISSRQRRLWQMPKSIKLYLFEKLKDFIINRYRYSI